ncbi:MAG: hypothetical protein ABIG69_15445 [Bacteroidota bacterium]
MPKVKFEYDISKDKWNVLRVINNPPVFEPDNLKRPLGNLPGSFVEKVRLETNPDEKDKIISDFLKNNYDNNKDFINERIKKFSQDWEKNNEEYFKRLEVVLNIKIPSGTAYTAYLTSAGSCPFNAGGRWFMVRLADEKVDVTVAHELMHIEFIRAYGFYCRDVLKLSPEEFGEFQEASTFLLNEEMGDLLSRPDYGYKEHQEIRNKLSLEWRKNKNFNELLTYYKSLKKEGV